MLEIEGLALNGFITSAKLMPCVTQDSYFKIEATLSNGEKVETECFEQERAGRTYAVISRYIEWGKVLIKRGYSEEVMKGITYDLDLGEG